MYVSQVAVEGPVVGVHTDLNRPPALVNKVLCRESLVCHSISPLRAISRVGSKGRGLT